MNVPEVSIIIPTYNSEKFIKRCLDSVLLQTFKDFEVVIIDNTSNDRTLDVVNGCHDERIKTYLIQNDGIIAKSRNFGINQSCGKYIAFLDSDDYWELSKLEEVVAVFRDNSEIDIVCHDEIHRADGVPDKKIKLGPHRTYRDLLVRGNCISTSSVVLKKEQAVAVGGFDEAYNLRLVEDYDFWLRLLKNGCSIFYLGIILGFYSIHDGNNSSRLSVYSRNYLYLLKAHLKHQKLISKIWRYGTYIKDIFTCHFVNKNYRDAFRNLFLLPFFILRR